MKYLPLLLLLCACRTTSESESRVHATAAETLDTGQRVETHTEEAPGKTTTTVREYAPPSRDDVAAPVVGTSTADARQGIEVAQDRVATAPAANRERPTHAATMPDHGPLVKETVTVTEQGQIDTTIVADLKSQQREDTALTGSAEEKSAFDFMHNPLMWIGAAVVLVVVLGTILYVVIKLRKVVPVP